MKGLKHVETTSGTNGYPQDIQEAIVGFENWEQLEEIAEKYKLEAYQSPQKRWLAIIRTSRHSITAFQKIAVNDFGGDDYSQEYDDADSYQKSEMEDVFPHLDLATFEEVEEWLKERKEVYNELLDLGRKRTL